MIPRGDYHVTVWDHHEVPTLPVMAWLALTAHEVELSEQAWLGPHYVGWDTADEIPDLVADVLDNPRDGANIETVRAKVNALTARFPVYR